MASEAVSAEQQPKGKKLNREELKRKLKRKASQLKHEQSFFRTDHLEDLPIWARVNKLNCFILFGIPLMAAYGVWHCYERIRAAHLLLAVFFHALSCIGITAGYHRLWSHKSFEANYGLQLLLMAMGSSALQGSVKWWALNHRAHHRFTDTDDDPYNAKRGFFYSHMGWMILDDIRISRVVDISDLRSNALVRWQHANYAWFGFFMALFVPTVVGWLVAGDLAVGLAVGGCLRLALTHHCTWAINSVAHFVGDATFDDTITARDHWLTAVVSYGEGYHNFHHEFPNDFRNGVRPFDWDPTKWFILAAAALGTAKRLRKFPDNEIRRGKLQMAQKRLDQMKKSVDFGVALDSLPIWDESTLKQHIAGGRVCVRMHAVVLDLTDFLRSGLHPGGRRLVAARNGEDVTADVEGAVYNHTNAARNLASHMRVALFKDDLAKDD